MVEVCKREIVWGLSFPRWSTSSLLEAAEMKYEPGSEEVLGFLLMGIQRGSPSGI